MEKAESIDIKIEKLLAKMSKLNSWEDRYKEIIQIGKSLAPLGEDEKKADLLVKGCQSQVWLKAGLSDQGNMVLKGESDSVIVQGLLGLLIEIYSGQKPSVILGTPPDFLEKLGLKKHLTPNRANGVYAMVKQILYYAQAFKLLQT